jgi:DNA-binding NtrC family response regulator
VSRLQTLLSKLHLQPGPTDSAIFRTVNTSVSAAPHDESSAKILAVTMDRHQRDQLNSLADSHGWNLVIAPDHLIAAEMLKTETFPIILCDRDTLNTDWRQAFRILLHPDRFKCLILCSAVDDDYLWQDVIHHGGYDVIRKPIDEDQAVRAIHFAWAFWKTVLAKHHPRRMTQE